MDPSSSAFSSSLMQTSTFPLFTTLYRTVSTQSNMDTPLSAEEKQEWLESVREMDALRIELTYVLIRCYHLEVDRRSFLESPYQMRRSKQGMRCDMDLLPIPLQRLLLLFTRHPDPFL